MYNECHDDVALNESKSDEKHMLELTKNIFNSCIELENENVQKISHEGFRQCVNTCMVFFNLN